MKSEFKLIVFHVLDEEQQKLFTKQTQYCVVGNYLCYRHRQMQKVWITKLKSDEDDYIPVNDFSNLDQANAEEVLQSEY